MSVTTFWHYVHSSSIPLVHRRLSMAILIGGRLPKPCLAGLMGTFTIFIRAILIVLRSFVVSKVVSQWSFSSVEMLRMS